MRGYDRVWKYIFVFTSLVTLALVLVPGRFVAYDEVFFKSPGRHWAATGQFAAPEIIGRIDVQPGLDVVYFAQPPIYSFVFGVYTKIVGFGPRQCILFDGLIHILLAILTMILARRVFDISARNAYVIGTLLLPLGTYGRPDELAMCIGIAGILCWTLELKPAHRALLSGVCFGLCGATSIGVWLFTSPMALLVGYHRRALTIGTAVRAIGAGAVVAALCVSPILISHPDAYKQLLAHASVQSPELGATVATGQSRLQSVLHSYVDGTVLAAQFHGQIMAIVLGALIVIALCFRALPKGGSRFFRDSAIVAMGGILFLWLILPGKAFYLWFFAPWLLSIAAAMLVSCLPSMGFKMRAVVMIVIVFFSAIGLGQYAKDRLVILTLPTDEKFDVNMSRVRELVPAGSRVVTGDYWWALADKCQVFDPNLSHPNPIDVDYFVKSGNGSGRAGKGQTFLPSYEAYEKDNHFVPVADYLNRTPLKLAGVRVTNSGYGFGPLILARDGSHRSPESR